MKRLLILMTLLVFTVGCAGGGDSEARVIALEGKMEALQTEIEGLRNELQNSNNALREAIESNLQRVEQQLQQQLQQILLYNLKLLFFLNRSLALLWIYQSPSLHLYLPAFDA